MIGLVLLNFNDFESTISFLKNIWNFSCLSNVVVVDNHSTNDSYQILKAFCSQNEKITVIKTNANLGYAGGNNFGVNYLIKNSNVEYILIANPDIAFSERTIVALKKIFYIKKNVGLVSCRMKNSKLPTAWKLPSYRDCLYENFILLNKVFSASSQYPASYFTSGIKKVEVLPGSFLLISKVAFLDVGGFDNETFLYYEENILCYKLKEKKYNCYIDLNNYFVHANSRTINKNIKSLSKKLEIANDSRLYYCEKYLGVHGVKLVLLKLASKIGINDYVFLKKILTFVKRRN